MTPEQIKAKELVDKYQKMVNEFTGNEERHSNVFSKRLAIANVEEIIKVLDEMNIMELGKVTGLYDQRFYHKVIEEINKL